MTVKKLKAFRHWSEKLPQYKIVVMKENCLISWENIIIALEKKSFSCSTEKWQENGCKRRWGTPHGGYRYSRSKQEEVSLDRHGGGGRAEHLGLKGSKNRVKSLSLVFGSATNWPLQISLWTLSAPSWGTRGMSLAEDYLWPAHTNSVPFTGPFHWLASFSLFWYARCPVKWPSIISDG